MIGARDYVVRTAPPGAEDALLAALADGGELYGLELACDLINVGNEKLEAAAKRWAEDHGYQVSTDYVAGGGGRRWGSGR